MVRTKEKLEFDDLFIVPNDDRGGGLALLRKGSIKVWMDSFSKYHIDSIVNGDLEIA